MARTESERQLARIADATTRASHALMSLDKTMARTADALEKLNDQIKEDRAHDGTGND